MWGSKCALGCSNIFKQNIFWKLREKFIPCVELILSYMIISMLGKQEAFPVFHHEIGIDFRAGESKCHEAQLVIQNDFGEQAHRPTRIYFF